MSSEDMEKSDQDRGWGVGGEVGGWKVEAALVSILVCIYMFALGFSVLQLS